MFPGNVLSSSPVIGRFLSYYAGEKDPSIDYCRAGKAINDSSLGLDYQLWRGRIKPNGDVVIAAQSTNYTVETVIINYTDAKNLTIAFDNNMRPAISVLVGTDLKFYWYDSTVSNYVTLTVANSRDAFARIDDVRDFASDYRDIIISYISNDKLYYRLTRDRYTVAYYLADVHPWQKIYQCGMTTQFRFQFSIVWDPLRISI